MVSTGGVVLVRLGLRPVRKLDQQKRRLAEDTLHRRLDGSSQAEELEPLIAQFNELLGCLPQPCEELEGFNADVADELCTPLVTLISSTELVLRRARGADELREVLGSNLEDLQRVAGIVQDFLVLSQADRGSSARRVATASLAGVARQGADHHDASLADARLRVEVTGDTAGDFGLPRLYDHFFRGDSERSDPHQNHGLGLAIVAAIACMHGGRPFASSTDSITSIGMTLLRVPGVAPEPFAMGPSLS